jgi:hypothetical protein
MSSCTGLGASPCFLVLEVAGSGAALDRLPLL